MGSGNIGSQTIDGVDLNGETACLPVTLPDGRTFLESPRADRLSAQMKQSIVDDYAKTGNITLTCQKFGVHPRFFRIAMNNDQGLMKAITEAREQLSDKAEGHIVEHMGHRANVIDRLAWLRAWRPGVWAPQTDQVVKHSVTVTHTLASAAQQYVDTTAQPVEIERAGTDKVGG